MKRRHYLKAAAAGAILVAFGDRPTANAKDQDEDDRERDRDRARDKNKDKARDKNAPPHASAAGSPGAPAVCDACGHVEFHEAPEFCPVCHAEERFRLRADIFTSARAKLPKGGNSHSPVIRVNDKSTFISDAPCKEVQVRVGEVMHESEKGHHIHFIDFYLDGSFFTRFFASPQMQPAVVLFVRAKATRIRAVSYCNQHGFWQSEAAV